jgi:hypothetical protein
MHSPALLDDVRKAFVHGLDVALIVSAGIALACVILGLAFMPGPKAGTPKEAEPHFTDRLSA